LVAVVTCPDKQAHQDAITAEMNGAIDSAIKDKTGLGDSDLGNSLSKITSKLTSKILGAAFETAVTVDNYFVFSVGKIDLDDKPKTVSVGLFGHVFTTFDADDLKSSLHI
jgi:hypothetical protein